MFSSSKNKHEWYVFSYYLFYISKLDNGDGVGPSSFISSTLMAVMEFLDVDVISSFFNDPCIIHKPGFSNNLCKILYNLCTH